MTSIARAVDAQGARALDDGPHAARLVRAGVGARLVLGLGRRSARPSASSGRIGASGSRATPSSAWISSSVST